jgi:hypothetical protein
MVLWRAEPVKGILQGRTRLLWGIRLAYMYTPPNVIILIFFFFVFSTIFSLFRKIIM